MAGVPQGPSLFLIYINDLSDNLLSNPKLFADDTSLFSVLHYKILTAKDLNDNLQKIRIWVEYSLMENELQP